MAYLFYGNENADIEAISTEYPGIRTPKDLYDLLCCVWCEYTCAPRLRDGWKDAHIACGQCSITAFLVQDIFGGRVYGILRPGGNYHCYNDVNGHVFDLTSEQFPGEDLCYEGNPEQFREVHFAKKEKYERYQYLRRALRRACGVRPDYRYLFFDLDGTLIKSEYGIIDSVLYALKKFGIEEQRREELKKFIGPALFESFQNFYGMNREDADRAVAYYREAYESEGIYNAPLYAGIKETLGILKEMGEKLYVITAKPQEMAEKVVRHTGIEEYFEAVVGPDRSERHTDKASLIRRALDLITPDDTEAASHTLMIGDRHYDMEGAAEAGVDAMGVLYGYGDRRELVRSGAAYMVGEPYEIASRLKEELVNDSE